MEKAGAGASQDGKAHGRTQAFRGEDRQVGYVFQDGKADADSQGVSHNLVTAFSLFRKEIVEEGQGLEAFLGEGRQLDGCFPKAEPEGPLQKAVEVVGG